MNGGHDLGGMHGLGPIQPEPEHEEPVFHSEWERRVFGLTLAAGVAGKWSIDASRHARERQHPADYLKNSYYENWLAGLEKQLVEWGLVTQEELEAGRAASPADPTILERVLHPEHVQDLLASGSPTDRDIRGEPRYKPGDRVRARNRNPEGHTREPRYVRGHIGVVDAHRGAHVYPDLSAEGTGGVKEGQHLYSVRFEATELWGEDAKGSAVYVDMWENYLEAAE